MQPETNKWLTMGVTPPAIAALFPPSAYETVKKTISYKERGAKGGAKASKIKDLSKDAEKLYEAYGFGGFTYKDIMALYGKSRYGATKLLSLLTNRTVILNSREPPRTYRGRAASIYSLKHNWKELYNEGL